MKKLLLSLLIGSVIMGRGIGITMLEISAWEISDYPDYLADMPSESCDVTIDMDLQEFENTEFYIYGTYRSMNNNAEIIEDKTLTDKFVVNIQYKGKEPVAYPRTYELDDETEHMDFVVHPGGFESFKLIRQVIEDMFENKVYYLDASPTLIEKVTVYTAYPEKIEVM